MRDINDILPKLPKNARWAALLNYWPDRSHLRDLDRMLPHDHKWHTVFHTPDSTIVDNIPIVKKKKESMA
jgi:hypothetical protein